MLKHELRRKYRQNRVHLERDEIETKSITLVNKILQIPIWDFFYFHTFLSIIKNKEVDTLPLITLLQGRDKHIVVPKVIGEHSMKHYLLTDNTGLRLNEWSIPEPIDGIEIPEKKIEVVFIPLLAFDKLGNRVGYGKGFYDEFLSKCDFETIKIGLSLFEVEEEPITDVHEKDIGLDYCVTPNQIYTF
ncbi:5-formyltetrahydrofolate cyclo-ligase [Flagellimonas meridianipacifica]|uniref:5-formyltetrahydrofolate cyclo-ligase n=1 Tax=Flagellimonas meridianipacifica TaxID=1080225 RepID=A0A2T0MGI0_9FLAO|nr:5-formyltetrahydrofolate cyclo-ligase [Allomuricauda pacifica]PRX56688.1 5-formyltetrahydrofolate cyclo-ligase [Allomuricauda pacifica]